jgi:arsenate reductase
LCKDFVTTGGKDIVHKGFEDPAAFSGREEEKLVLFRRVRDEIRAWIEETFGGEMVP